MWERLLVRGWDGLLAHGVREVMGICRWLRVGCVGESMRVGTAAGTWVEEFWVYVGG